MNTQITSLPIVHPIFDFEKNKNLHPVSIETVCLQTSQGDVSFNADLPESLIAELVEQEIQLKINLYSTPSHQYTTTQLSEMRRHERNILLNKYRSSLNFLLAINAAMSNAPSSDNA